MNRPVINSPTRNQTDAVDRPACAPGVERVEKGDAALFLHQPHAGVRVPHAKKLPVPFADSTATVAPDASPASEERRRARRYPFSRWYLRPAAGWLAGVLAPTRVRPVHLTVCGLLAAGGAVGMLLWRPEARLATAGLVLLYWLFDRADGQLARRQRTASAWGAWLDGNVDELVDIGLHVAIASVVASRVSSSWPWLLLAGFLAGKYLLMYGLTLEEHAAGVAKPAAAPSPARTGLFHRLYHSLANADVRIHVLALVLAAGWLASELVIVAVYYNLRWIARYVLVPRRLRGVR